MTSCACSGTHLIYVCIHLILQVAQHIRSLMDHMESGSSTVSAPQHQQQQQQQQQERPMQSQNGEVFSSSRPKPIGYLSARDAAIAVQKQDAAGISAQIRRVGRRLFEALDYLDCDRLPPLSRPRSCACCLCVCARSGLVSVGELLSELEGLGINVTAAQLQLPQDETSNVNYAEFLRLHSKR